MRSRTLIPIAAVAVAAVALLAAGCGGGSSKSAAKAGLNELLAYSNCIRSHGVQNFPDPTITQGIPKDQSWIRNPKMRSASKACQQLMPASGLGPPTSTAQTATRVADALSFARCMRSHGVTSFPDPTAQGELSVEMVRAQGIDMRSPAVLRAVQACLPASHGLLTPAKVRQALNDAGG